MSGFVDGPGKPMNSGQSPHGSGRKHRSHRHRNKALKRRIAYGLVAATLLMLAVLLWLRLVS